MSKANEVVYTFQASLEGGSASDLAPSTFTWSFEVPSLLTTTTTIEASSLLSASVTGVLASDGCQIKRVTIIEPATVYAVQTKFTNGCGGVTFTDLSMTISSLGTFGFTNPANGNCNSLTVGTSAGTSSSSCVAPPVSGTPEPSSLLLLGSGLLGLGPFLRRNRA